MRAIASSFLVVASAGALAVACNSILDNSAGTLDVDAGDATAPSSFVDAADDATTSANDVSVVDSAQPLQTDDASTCDAGQKFCGGACVAIDDPAYGCGATCEACSLAHASATCAGAACGVGSCDPGYADCDGTAKNGCETDLSSASTCGACNASCGATAPDCQPVGASFECTTGCGSAAPTLCGSQCTDLSTSVDHCGDCNVACAAVAHATVACTAGDCTFTCKVGMANCDGLASNGCESVLATDPKNCGTCGNACPATACQNGLCAAPSKDAGAPSDAESAQDSGGGSPSDAAAD